MSDRAAVVIDVSEEMAEFVIAEVVSLSELEFEDPMLVRSSEGSFVVLVVILVLLLLLFRNRLSTFDLRRF